jgi:hypothetical protein
LTFNNLVINGDFEIGSLSPWDSEGASITGENSHSGLYSVRLAGGTDTAYLTQLVPVTPGENYELFTSLAKVGGAPSPFVSVSLFYLDGSFNIVGYDLVDDVYENRLPNGVAAEWITVYHLTSVVPQSATQALIAIYKAPEAGTSDLLVDDVQLLEATGSQGPAGPTGPTGPAGEYGPPYEVYVRAGAVGGNGTPAAPYGTIPQGIAAAAQNGTVHILAGTYSITSQIVVNKQGITLQGEPGNLLLLQADLVPLMVVGNNITIAGLKMTSDVPYAKEFIQVGGDSNRILDTIIFGPPQPLPMSNWVVNRAVVTQANNSTNLLVRGNIFYCLRTGMYLNPGTTGNLIENVVYNTKGGFLVDRAVVVLSGNSWGLPINEFDIVLLAGTISGSPYDPTSALSIYNNGATISDQR